MSTVIRGSTRATSTVAALLLVILSFGVAGAAYADPGTGNGNDGSNPGNAYGADNGNGADTGNGADNGNAYGADNGSGAPSETPGPAAAAATASAKSDSSSSTSTESSSSKGASAKSAGSGSTKSSSSAGTASDHKTKGTAGTSGTPPAPQPISGADDNPGGANGQCPGGVYCGTPRDHASMNGNGGGKAVGKPCAGCVGKADNKNPPGQMPGPQDHNNGYECDGNKGIGKTNPAHTGCKPGTPPCVGAGCNPPPPPPPAPPPPAPPAPLGPSEVVCPPGSMLVNGVCVYGEEDILCPDGSVMPPSGKCDKAKPPTVRGEEAFRPPVKAAQAGVLPATGSSSGVGLLAGLGFTMLALGVGVMMRRRAV